jgi:hypothetical protein
MKQSGLQENDLAAHGYDAFGVFGTIFKELEWKTPILTSWRAVPTIASAS